MVAYITIATRPGDGQCIQLQIRDPDGSGANKYWAEYCQVAGTANDTIKLWKTVSETDTQLGSTYTFSTDPSDGFALGVSAVSTAIGAWYKASGGSWTEVASATDSSISGAGTINLVDFYTDARYDDFGGGTVTP
jgi:hypothetical protein